MSAREPLLAREVRPHWGRLLVVEAEVDASERRSGLIVSHDLSDGVKRGVVTAVDEEYEAESWAGRASGRCITVGMVVYFLTRGSNGAVPKILDTYVVDPAMIIAYEPEPDR